MHPLQPKQEHGEPRGRGGQRERGGQQGHGEQQGRGGRRGRDALQGHGGEQHGNYAVTGGTLQYRGEPDHGIGHLQLRYGLPIQEIQVLNANKNIENLVFGENIQMTEFYIRL